MATASPEIWTVAQVTRRVKNLLEDQLGEVWLMGEITDWRPAASGHAYFCLKDEQCRISAVMFKGNLRKVRFDVSNGLEVLAHGRVSVYEPRGQYQIILDEMQPKGVGALQLAYEQLKKKLAAEGLFDEGIKKPLPMLPRRIGIVTSPTGAAIRDILNVLNRRFANVHVVLHPARVQGEGAAAEIAEGIAALDKWGVDVMIVGRGGGSLEDLWAFNEEAVVRAIYAARTPIISAVGHEIDYTLSDFAADVRAPTPSAGAEIVLQEREQLLEQVARQQQRLERALRGCCERLQFRLQAAMSSYVLRRPEEIIRQRRQLADELHVQLSRVMQDRVSTDQRRVERAQQRLALVSPARQVFEARERWRRLLQRLMTAGRAAPEGGYARLRPLAAQLDALSPLAVLQRGYALVWHGADGKLVRSASALTAKDNVSLQFADGAAEAVIQEVKEKDNGREKA